MPRDVLLRQPGAIIARAVRAGPFVYLSGHGGHQPDGRLPEGVAAQTRAALQKIAEVLGTYGGSLDDVVRCEVFLADLHDKAAMNDVWREHFPSNPPARITVQVVLEGDARIEISSTAYLG